ncbi:MAG: ABC transporter ATP-binding protein [Gammaproteobacteria bacterium]|nr:ABC transporter ATP-binding protein [Gammaproteobacteria bacterium]
MHALEIQALTKTYKNGVQALKGINLNVKKGDFFALLGANGAGKSTTIGLITSLLTKTSGHIRIHGYDLETHPNEAKSLLGVVPQEFNLNIFETCEQILLNQAGYYGISTQKARPMLEKLLKQLGLTDKRHQIVRYLSGGMKRRLMIARALMHRPSILILDEPTAGVDIEIRHSMWEFLKETNERGTTIILTTHYLEEAEQLCKNVAIIHQGDIIENTSISHLLSTLTQQTFIFNTSHRIKKCPDLSPFTAQLIDDHSFEIQIEHTTSLNDVFLVLSQQKLLIQSIRTKTNRLEALFMDRITHEQ